MIGVVGLGAMGLGIAQVFAAAGHEVRVTDAAPAMRDSALARLAEALAPRVAKGALSGASRDALLARVTVVESAGEIGPVMLAVEAVVERIEVKRAVFAALEAGSGGAVMATNTSSIPVAEIARGMARPERLVGLHFFNPAPVMKLVEVIGHAGSDAAAIDLARRVTEAAGKVVIAAPDRPGFIVNRCARPFYGEALALLAEGRGAAEVDAAMVAAGYRIGPFGLIDLIGADINLAATEGLAAAMGGHPRYHVFAALREQVAAGRLGRKSGAGFVYPSGAVAPPADAAQIALRIEATLVNEAGWLLAEGGVSAGDIDTGLTLGLNFPRGPFAMLQAQGRAAVRATLAGLAASAPPALRGRYDLSPLLA
ncbi:3-hydroxyacyl-CoA dehydrogenase [Paragemmobacter straminiformis]|uniref:3-hydroxybutyryl-CoA dehydrogenase n=1 Tax=Paragemmobacter straminiformis TaxID=2045119 RepID=A0A842I832_9RHOB|nr:3-hydroxyacyl-CoA dehydrogenase NAD-binding domain-containing protein [Gemmobacter straminiformis]MBC2835731.1 3-hydroxybutyryl-CoA dehydrogenase [Gemmobacter straminiformis]